MDQPSGCTVDAVLLRLCSLSFQLCRKWRCRGKGKGFGVHHVSPCASYTADPGVRWIGSYFTCGKLKIRQILVRSPDLIVAKTSFHSNICLTPSYMLSPLLREKLTEVHEELQKKQELIEDLQPDISQNGKFG